MASILLLEDEDNLRAMLVEILHAAGHQVVADRDGRRVQEVLRLAPVDLVITDVVMPNCDGIETILGLRKSHPRIPVIAISGDVSRHAPLYLNIAEKLGAVRTLQKPFGVEVFLGMVREVWKAMMSKAVLNGKSHP